MEPSWGGLESSWMHVDSYPEPYWAILHDLGGHVDFSGALLEPSWAILGAPTLRGPPRLGPGGGGRGRENPLPEWEEWGLAEQVLQTTHALKGWWDFLRGRADGGRGVTRKPVRLNGFPRGRLSFRGSVHGQLWTGAMKTLCEGHRLEALTAESLNPYSLFRPTRAGGRGTGAGQLGGGGQAQ